jgi:anti-anti-sigma regulatory factor
VDASGDQMLRDYSKRLTESGINVLFTRVRKPIMRVFRRSHMFDDVSKEYFHRDPTKAFEHAWDLIISESEV